MSVTELLPSLRGLSRADKLRVMQILVDDLAREESVLEHGRTYDVWSPHDAYGAAETLQAVLGEADDARH